MSEGGHKSFSDPDTHFHIVLSDTPFTVDGFNIGEPTGEIECCECGASHLNIDEIPHDDDCGQRFVKSDFWAQNFVAISDCDCVSSPAIHSSTQFANKHLC